MLEVAVEYPEYALIVSNPARGRRRRLKADKPAPVWLDSAEQISTLLDAAGELDRAARCDRQVPRRRDERSKTQLAQLVGVEPKRQRKGGSGVSERATMAIESNRDAEIWL
ncbi:MAG: hypothetical protein ABSG95_06030 [Solirubrobacteraceae bacterium]